jgi:hypothetical protein
MPFLSHTQIRAFFSVWWRACSMARFTILWLFFQLLFLDRHLLCPARGLWAVDDDSEACMKEPILVFTVHERTNLVFYCANGKLDRDFLYVGRFRRPDVLSLVIQSIVFAQLLMRSLPCPTCITFLGPSQSASSVNPPFSTVRPSVSFARLNHLSPGIVLPFRLLLFSLF